MSSRAGARTRSQRQQHSGSTRTQYRTAPADRRPFGSISQVPPCTPPSAPPTPTMTSSRAMFLAALAVILSAATLTAAAATPTAAAASAAATVTPSGGSGTFAVTITDQGYRADTNPKYLGVVSPGATAASTIAKVPPKTQKGPKHASSARRRRKYAQARRRRDVPAATGRAYATGDLSGKYGALSATKSVSNGNFLATQNQVNNDQASATRVIIDPSLSAAALDKKSLVLTDASGKQVGCVALSVSGASSSSSTNNSSNNGSSNGSSNSGSSSTPDSGKSGDTKSSAAGMAAPVSSAVAVAAAVFAAVAAFAL
ncbi:hypothetical protein AMAG_09427 [Allomyces macrogynus ATCC 38327]|uniref:Superoxide dismutase copper/zinc binding domain-containing protein n=1 Tax=Allomyces macrogynus (strain ATCC 38327) TaxID=578462 RepID=A0A0L0SPR8_ALLM3|nr:hypothetical protein AMAG_09427 [Allomyces macrogynus ATCC 38327]|eukprot:KNE64404.1 hypothetical protein AMAG_09427 [Allomyces macrogynus ATCC 38327]